MLTIIRFSDKSILNMEWNKYLTPISLHELNCTASPVVDTLYDKTVFNTVEEGFPELDNVQIVLFGICDDRGSAENSGCKEAAKEIRRKLYRLAAPHEKMRIADIGDVAAGDTQEDTYYAVTNVVYQLIEQGKTVIALGGSQDMTYAVYKAYEIMGQIVNICAIDSRFDLEDSPEKVTSHSYLNHIVMQDPNYLFNFTNIGYQTYFVGAPYVKLMDELKFDAYRVGAIQHDMMKAEPLMRNADIVSVDISAIRQCDAPAQADPSPHGFYGEQLCQMSRFAGMSDKTSCIGFHEMNPHYDNNGQTAHMVAHAVWFFIEGFYNRQYDFPYRDKQNYKRFLVELKDQGLELVFHKSKKSDRWWVEVPCNDLDRRNRYNRHLLIPCNYSDYEQAMQNEIPDLWWKYYSRLND